MCMNYGDSDNGIVIEYTLLIIFFAEATVALLRTLQTLGKVVVRTPVSPPAASSISSVRFCLPREFAEWVGAHRRIHATSERPKRVQKGGENEMQGTAMVVQG